MRKVAKSNVSIALYMQENLFLEKQDETKNTMFVKKSLRKILTQKTQNSFKNTMQFKKEKYSIVIIPMYLKILKCVAIYLLYNKTGFAGTAINQFF